MTSKRFVSQSLATLLLIGILASCGGEAVSNDTTAGDTASTTVSAPEETVITHDIPDDVKFDGQTFRILSVTSVSGFNPNYHWYLLSQDEMSGDVLNDSLYERNLVIAERFGIEFEEELVKWNTAEERIRSMVSAGDDQYDVAALNDRTAVSFYTENLLVPIDEVKYVDLEKPYWNQSINESLTFGGHQYFAYNDAMLSAYDYTYAMIFNKDYVDQYKFPNLYELVLDGKWTLDRFKSMCQSVNSDLNGNTQWDENDRYGWLCAPKQVSPLLWIGAGELSVEKNEEDIPEFTMNNQGMLDMLQKAYDFAWGDTFWYQSDANRSDVIDPPLFADGNAMFSSLSFANLFDSYYRDIEFTYGIIPHPKLDEEQSQYYSRVEGGFVYCIPITVMDSSFSGAILEALACESMKTVIPAYYEVSLKGKFARDDESMQILDLIMDTRVFDLGDTVFNENIRDGFVLSNFQSKRVVSASDIESNRSVVENQIKKVVDRLVG